MTERRPTAVKIIKELVETPEQLKARLELTVKLLNEIAEKVKKEWEKKE
jgi:ribosomal protein L31E